MASPPGWRPILLDFLPDDLTSNLLAEYAELESFLADDSPAPGGPSRGTSQVNSQMEDTSSIGETDVKAKTAVDVGGVEGTLTADSAQKAFSLNKATREKLRRERLNERFAELGKLLNLRGTNVDKLRVLSEAIHELKSLREETTQLKNTNHRLHLANTMTSEMAVSLLKAQRDVDPANKRSAEETVADALHPQHTLQQGNPAMRPLPFQTEPATFSMEDRERLGSNMMKAQQLHASTIDAKRRRLESDSNTAPVYQQMHPVLPNKMDTSGLSSTGWPVHTWPQNMTMNMWMPAASQDTSQDHLLRPPVA